QNSAAVCPGSKIHMAIVSPPSPSCPESIFWASVLKLRFDLDLDLKRLRRFGVFLEWTQVVQFQIAGAGRHCLEGKDLLGSGTRFAIGPLQPRPSGLFDLFFVDLGHLPGVARTGLDFEADHKRLVCY